MDLEKIKKEMINALKQKFKGCSVEAEYGGAMRFVLNITWKGFEGMPEDKRQEKVWKFLSEEFPYSKMQFLTFVMTWTKEEQKTYSKEMA